MNSFDRKSVRSFEDVIAVYHSLKSLGYSDEDLCLICGFLHDALKLYLYSSNSQSEIKPINLK